MISSVRIAFISLILAATVGASPVIVFNDFGPGDSDMPGPGITVGCGALCFLDAGHSHAWLFVPSITTSFSTLETVASGMGPNVTAVFTISGDAGGVPGVPLESFSVAAGFPAQVYLFSSSLHAVLQAGIAYWFTAATADLLNQAAQIGINSIGVTGPEALRIGNGAWTPTGSSAFSVFRVTGDAVPEPSTFALFGLGGLLLASRARRHTIR